MENDPSHDQRLGLYTRPLHQMVKMASRGGRAEETMCTVHYVSGDFLRPSLIKEPGNAPSRATVPYPSMTRMLTFAQLAL